MKKIVIATIIAVTVTILLISATNKPQIQTEQLERTQPIITTAAVTTALEANENNTTAPAMAKPSTSITTTSLPITTTATTTTSTTTSEVTNTTTALTTVEKETTTTTQPLIKVVTKETTPASRIPRKYTVLSVLATHTKNKRIRTPSFWCSSLNRVTPHFNFCGGEQQKFIPPLISTYK